MKHKAKRTDKRTSILAGVEMIDGWVLITREEAAPRRWYIAWLELFPRKEAALNFAAENKWSPPFKAVRATLSAVPK